MQSPKPIALIVVALLLGLPFANCFVPSASAKGDSAQAKCCASKLCDPGALNRPDCCKKLHPGDAPQFKAEKKSDFHAPALSAALAVLWYSPARESYPAASFDQLLDHGPPVALYKLNRSFLI
jgi:hypothetical protein